MLEIKSNITCTRCGKDILSCNCENSPRTKIEQLEKENAELKARISDYEKLEKFLDETLKEKLEQIEKMKCCGNCKCFEPITNYCTKKCEKIMSIFRNCEIWELAE